LQAIECHVMHREQNSGQQNGTPVKVDQQQRQRYKHPEVEFEHAACQLDVQLDQGRQHKGQNQARGKTAAQGGIGKARQRHQDRGGRQRQA